MRQRRHNAFFIDSFTVARMRADRGGFQMRRTKPVNLDADSD
jgi:hypothetical protein